MQNRPTRAMLHVSVSIHRKFKIACDLLGVEAHFRNFERMLEDLPDLNVSRVWGLHQYSIGYSMNFAGIYRVDLFSDVQARFDAADHVLVVSPLPGRPSVTAQATPWSLTGQGDYASRLVFHAQKDCTGADYDLTITADIPKPVRLNLVPDSVARIAVQAVVRRRVHEITDLFIVRTKSRLAG